MKKTIKKIQLITLFLTSAPCICAWDWESVKMSLNPNYQKIEEKTTTKYERRPEAGPVKQEVSKKYKTKRDGGTEVTIKERYTTKE